MADVGVSYLLDTPGTDITFNQYTTPYDTRPQYYVTEIRGLESPSLRTPTDPVPLGDGELIHTFYYGATHITFEGLIWIPPTYGDMNTIVAQRNTMTAALKSAVNSILAADGTLTFTPTGGSLQTITGVRYEVGLQTPQADNYNSLQFSFGLITGTPYA